MTTDNTQPGTKRFDESHNLRGGVVQDTIDLEDRWSPDETTVTVTEWTTEDHYALSMADHAHSGDTTILFDKLSYHDGTLWFQRTIGDESVTTGCIDWHILEPRHDYGLVGEWFREHLDLDSFRTGAKCTECGGEILNDQMLSGCENLDCGVIFEGVPDESWPRIHDDQSEVNEF